METQTQLEKVRKVSKVVRMIFKALIVLTIIIFVTVVAAIIIGPKSDTLMTNLPGTNSKVTWGEISVKMDEKETTLNQLTTASKVLLIFFVTLYFVVALKVQHHLHRLFANYAEGHVFTAESVAQIRKLGFTLFLVAGLKLLAERSFPFEALITGGLVILISWVMDAARNLREENEATI
jgi:preprotein translocase subunit SecG